VASLGGVPADLGGVAANGGDPAARDYAVRLLLDAVRPSAPPEVAGRCLTALLTTLATPTTVDALATLLAAAPGAASHFEVVAEEPGRGRTGHRSHLAADQAVTAALALLRRPGLVIDVFAIAGGLRRRCLQGRDGYLMWVVPDRQELTGPEEEVTAALARWAANLAPIGPVGPPQPTGPTGATKLRPQVDPGVPALPDGARGDPSSSLRVDETAGPGTKDGQGEVAEALRAVLAELTVQVDLGGIEQVVAEAVRMEIARRGRPAGVGRAGPEDTGSAEPAGMASHDGLALPAATTPALPAAMPAPTPAAGRAPEEQEGLEASVRLLSTLQVLDAGAQREALRYLRDDLYAAVELLGQRVRSACEAIEQAAGEVTRSATPTAELVGLQRSVDRLAARLAGSEGVGLASRRPSGARPAPRS